MYEYDQNQDYPSYTPPEHSGMATASMILGILGIIGSMCCYLALPMSAIGILLALLSRGSNKHLSSRAKNGLWLSIASLVLTVGMTGYTLYKYRDIINSPQFQQQMEDYLEYYYGGKEAQIVDFTIEDARGMATNSIEKMEEFTIKVKIQFFEDVDAPIYTYTIKDLKGTEITGTNTMYEKVTIEPQKKGNSQIVTFTQVMNLQGGNYLLSLGCTGYRNGEFTVYHRLYDVCNITVVSSKNTVGFFDMDSQVTVEDA